MVGFLNEMFSKFDELAEKYNVEKIKTIGDSYIKRVVAGLTLRTKDHATILFEFGQKLIEISSKYKDHMEPYFIEDRS